MQLFRENCTNIHFFCDLEANSSNGISCPVRWLMLLVWKPIIRRFFVLRRPECCKMNFRLLGIKMGGEGANKTRNPDSVNGTNSTDSVKATSNSQYFTVTFVKPSTWALRTDCRLSPKIKSL